MSSRFQRIPFRIFKELRRELVFVVPSTRPCRILFDHIPKCAGTALNAYLEAHYPQRKIFTLSGQRPKHSVAKFKSLSNEKRNLFALIKGHLAGYLLDDVHPQCLKVTVLREPVDRIVSHYYYAKRNPVHYLHETIHRKNISLKDYVESDLSHELSNHYTLHFSGLSREEARLDPEAAIAKAIERIGRYDLVGFQEDFLTFVQQLCQRANLRLPFPEQKVNVTRNRKGVGDIDDETRWAIEAGNGWDTKLFKKIVGFKIAPVSR